jgi:hypothetical protein
MLENYLETHSPQNFIQGGLCNKEHVNESKDSHNPTNDTKDILESFGSL